MKEREFLKIKLHPNSKKIKILKTKNGFEIWTKSRAELNRANLEMMEILSNELKIEVKKIKIISGHHRPNKMIKLS